MTEPVVERLFWSAALTRVAGVDEVGMGPLAGPVVAAAVIFTPGPGLAGIADCKRLTADEREHRAAQIRGRAAGVGVGVVPAPEVDRLNVYRAGLEAMRRALAALTPPPEYVLVDGRVIPGLPWPQTRYVKGDAFVYSIAAASIVAKVHRDALMHATDARYPQYGFRRHVGYATAEHLRALARFGPSPEHRRSFAPVASAAAAARGSVAHE